MIHNGDVIDGVIASCLSEIFVLICRFRFFNSRSSTSAGLNGSPEIVHKYTWNFSEFRFAKIKELMIHAVIDISNLIKMFAVYLICSVSTCSVSGLENTFQNITQGLLSMISKLDHPLLSHLGSPC